jgi:DNA-directed RNA polymerase specialized sigma24 family protein
VGEGWRRGGPSTSGGLWLYKGVKDSVGGFERWYRGEHPRLVAAMLLVCGDLDEAREAADEALARALARWPRVSQMESPAGWTYRVALRVLWRRRRRAAVERRLLLRVAPRPNVPPPAGEAWEVVAKLPERQRTALVLRYVADLTEREVSAAMGVSRGTISSTLVDARRALARLLGDDPSITLEVGCA